MANREDHEIRKPRRRHGDRAHVEGVAKQRAEPLVQADVHARRRQNKLSVSYPMPTAFSALCKAAPSRDALKLENMTARLVRPLSLSASSLHECMRRRKISEGEEVECGGARGQR